MTRVSSLVLLIAAFAGFQLMGTEKSVIDRLLQLARTQPGSEALKAELIAVMGQDRIRKGTAIAGNGPNFVWAVEPELSAPKE